MRRQRGFTILETLIAFAILSIVAIVTYRALADAMTRSTKTSAISGAVDLGDSLLAEHSIDAVYDTSQADGDEGPYHWRITATPFLPNERPRSPRVPVIDLKVEVTWAHGTRGISLHTLAFSQYPRTH